MAASTCHVLAAMPAPTFRIHGGGWQVTQTLSEEQRKDMTPLKLRRKARDFALKTINSQRLGFQR